MPQEKLLNLIFTAVVIAALGIPGYAIYVLSESQATNQMTTRGTVQPSATPDETAVWKTYRNEEYGFEMKYPPQYLVKEYPYSPGAPATLFSVCFQASNTPGVVCEIPRFDVVFNTADKRTRNFTSFSDWVKSRDTIYSQKEEISIDGHQGFKFTNPEKEPLNSWQFVIVDAKDYLLELNYDRFPLPESEMSSTVDSEKMPPLESFLSTFQFTK